MDRLLKIREKLSQKGLDGVLITDEKNQRYATGFAFTDGAVLITRSRAFLFTDSRYIEAAEKTVSPDIELRMFGAGKPLPALIKAELAECCIEKLGAEEMSLPHGRYLDLERRLGLGLVPCQSIFYELRAAKDEDELCSMRAAQAIAERALDDVLRIIRPGVTERDIAAEITYRLLKHGGEGNSFDPIAVSGANSSMPHGVPSDKRVEAGDFVTMDFGCIKDGYCSDMTRTVFLGEPDSEMRAAWDALRKANESVEAMLRPGVTGKEAHERAEEVLAAAGLGGRMGHGLGHGVGIDIHEEPVLAPRNERPLVAGNVVTVEPGIYLPGKFGMRLEDFGVVTDDGFDVFTNSTHDLVVI